MIENKLIKEIQETTTPTPWKNLFKEIKSEWNTWRGRKDRRKEKEDFLRQILSQLPDITWKDAEVKYLWSNAVKIILPFTEVNNAILQDWVTFYNGTIRDTLDYSYKYHMQYVTRTFEAGPTIRLVLDSSLPGTTCQVKVAQEELTEEAIFAVICGQGRNI